MGRKKKPRKEEICEDWCFVCKDGGLLMVCEYKDCLKAYHPDCVGKDDSFLETGSYERCGWHNCFLCGKTSKFQCFCCPNSVCGLCLCDVDFSIVKGKKGFCSHCLKLAQLVEENADVDSDGGRIDFKDPETYEFLFSDYYKIIKEKEGWSSQQVHSAHKLLKNGKSFKVDYDLLEIGENEDSSGESDDNFLASDYDDLNGKEAFKPAQKRKNHSRELKTIKGKTKSKKEFIDWGSKSLIEFLDYIGRDTSKMLSQHDVTDIILEYCREKKLFEPKKKNKVLCDERLKCLLRRKSVKRNSIFNLLTSHFAENCEEMEDYFTSSSEERDQNNSVKSGKQSKLSSSTASHEELGPEEYESCFAAIVPSNIKLVYLKRSLIEELLSEPDTFDGKVIGSFVRVKADPNDYLQKNSHLLLQVVGIKRPSKDDEINKQILLHLWNVPKIDVPICKVSDDDFSEEECQDLRQRMKNGLLLQPTVIELEQKARSLHEDIIKHRIPRELALLQIRIDQANEKGWRRQLYIYMNQKMELESQSEQSRLLNDSPKVIPEVVSTKPSEELEDSSRKDKRERNGLPELVLGEACSPPGNHSNGSNPAVNNRTDATGSTPKTTAVIDQDCRTNASSVELPSPNHCVQEKDIYLSCTASICCTTSKISLHQPRDTDSGSDQDVKNLDAAVIIEEKKSVSVSNIISVSDDGKEDIQVGENPEIPIWYCVGPYGAKVGPVSLSLLKRWSETLSGVSKFKIWKTGQSETEAIFLTDALRQWAP